MKTQRVNPMRALLLVLMLTSPIAFASDVYSTEAYRERCGGDVFPACNSWFATTGLNQWSMFEHAVRTAYAQKKIVLVVTGTEVYGYSSKEYLNFTSIDDGGDPAVVRYAAQNYVVVPIDINKNGSGDVLKTLGVYRGLNQLIVFDPVQRKTIGYVGNGYLLESISRHYSCRYTNGRLEDVRYRVNLRLEFLKNPSADSLVENIKRTTQDSQLCGEAVKNLILDLEEKNKN